MTENIETVVEDIRDNLNATADADDFRRWNARPLPDAHDVARYLNASRAAATAHCAMLDAGQPDWARGTPLQPLLFRGTSLCDDTGVSLLEGALDTVAQVGLEADYAITMVRDAIARLDPRKDKASIVYMRRHMAALACSLASIALAHGSEDPKTAAWVRAFAATFASDSPDQEAKDTAPTADNVH